MRRFVFSEGGSNKFWEAGVEGNSLTVRWGKVGTEGQAKTKDFASAAAADAEMSKVVREKTGKGYVEEKGSPAKAGKAAPASKPAKALGPHLTALLQAMRKKPRRKKSLDRVAAVLAKTLPEDLRAFFTAWNEHNFGVVGIGEVVVEDSDFGCRVPDAEDRDRDDVLQFAHSPGGDVFVIDVPVGKQTSITRLVHDEDFSDGGGWTGLDELVREHVERAEEDGDSTDLEDELNALLGRKEQDRKAGKPAELKVVKVRGAAGPIPQAIAPAWKKRLGKLKIFEKCYHVCLMSVAPDGQHMAVLAKDGVYEAFADGTPPRRVCDGDTGEDAVTVCHTGTLIGVLRPLRGKRLELYARDGSGYKRAHSIASEDHDNLVTAAGGRVLVVSPFDASNLRYHSYILGVRDQDVRLLGNWKMNLREAWDADGKAMVADAYSDRYELRELDKALAWAFSKKPEAIKLPRRPPI